MHRAILDATGYILLLSSFVTLAILLRGGCKYEKKSSFFILSTSDVFSAILTAIVLLVSHVEAGIKLSYNWRNDTGDVANRTWIGKSESEHRFLFMQIRDFRETTEEIDADNLTLMCDAKNLIMQYGMLLAPLTNAFISLLTFTVQCNLNATCMKRRCSNITSLSSNIRTESKCVKITCQKRGILQDRLESTSQQDNVNAMRTSGDVLQRLTRISKFQTLQGNEKKLAGFFVTSHWILPFLVIVILHFAEYSDMRVVQHAEDSGCIFGSNFPVNDFYISPIKEDSSKILPFGTYKAPLENYYFINEGLSNKSNPDSTEVNRIVSKVQNIVRIMLGQRYNFTLDTGTINPFDGSGLQDATEYLLTNVTNVRRITNNTDKIIQRTNYTTEQNEASEESNTTTIGSLSEAMQTSVKNKDNNYREDTKIYLANAEENITQRTTSIPIVQDVISFSNNRIYIDLTKRMQAASMHAAVKSHRNHSVLNGYHSRKQLKRNDSIERIVSAESNSIKDLFLNKNGQSSLYTDIETKNDSFCMINKCLVSNKFLKLHLFILTITIYFLPILFCCVLQTRGKYICENTLATLKTADLISTSSSSGHNNTANELQSEQCSSSDKRIYQQDSNEKSNAPQEAKDIHSHATDIEVTNKSYESYTEMQNKGMFSEIDCTMRILRTIKMSLILCIILWTPIFLGTLLRVFSCVHAPQWLTDTTFLGAISYSIIRNYLNISILKIQEFCSNDNNTKENRIHPAE